MKVFLSAEWKYLLMLNYEVDPEILIPFVPAGTELDNWNNMTFVSMVGFLFLNTRVKGVAIPFHRNFDEINLRFYVKRVTDNEVRRGVVFIKEIVPRYAIARIANLFYNENYVARSMNSIVDLGHRDIPQRLRYSWFVKGSENFLEGTIADSSPSIPEPGSEGEYITEHSWGYVPQRNGRIVEYKVEHPQWDVWPVKSSVFSCDIQANYGEQFVEALSKEPTSAFVARGSEVKVYSGGYIN